jgi:phosphatidylinositol glycan class S
MQAHALLHASNAGARTSFKVVAGVQYEDALSRDLTRLPKELAGGRFCDKWAYRCQAAARTWTRPHAQDNLMCAPALPFRCLVF